MPGAALINPRCFFSFSVFVGGRCETMAQPTQRYPPGGGVCVCPGFSPITTQRGGINNHNVASCSAPAAMLYLLILRHPLAQLPGLPGGGNAHPGDLMGVGLQGTPQAVFTSFKLPKPGQVSAPQAQQPPPNPASSSSSPVSSLGPPNSVAGGELLLPGGLPR